MRAARRPGRSAADARAFAARDSRRTRSSRMRATAVVAPRFAFEASESGAARARGHTAALHRRARDVGRVLIVPTVRARGDPRGGASVRAHRGICKNALGVSGVAARVREARARV